MDALALPIVQSSRRLAVPVPGAPKPTPLFRSSEVELVAVQVRALVPSSALF